jgi:DNA-directed RNA polymerase specialized sigma24 family protein
VCPVTPEDSEGALWDAVGRGDVTASAELFRRHGAVAYAVARAVTGDSERAAQAVVTAFVELRRHAADTGPPRSLRVEVLDASRRSAGRLSVASPGARRGRRRWPRGAYRAMSPDVRDVLALATAGGCGCTEIAAIMRADRESVCRDLRVGLRHAAALLDARSRRVVREPSTTSLGGHR